MSSALKQLVLGALTLAVTALGWSVLNANLEKKAGLLEIGIIFAIFLISFGILFSFCALFIKKKSLWLLAILSLLPFLIFEKSYYLLGGTILFFLAMFWSYRRFKIESQEMIKFRFFSVSSRALPAFLTGFSLILAVIIAFSPQVSKITIEIPSSLFDPIFGAFSKIIGWQYPGFHSEITVDEFLLLALSRQIQTFKKPLSLKLPSGAVSELLAKKKQELSEKLNLEITGKEKVKDILCQIANRRLTIFIKLYEDYLPPAFILFGFMIIKTLTWPLKWIIIFLGHVLLKILLAIKLISIKKERVEKETITL